MSFVNPGVPDFKNYFVRDFNYGTAITQVQDVDIANAMADCAAFINVQFFATQQTYNVGFFALSAHFLVTNIRASTQGISGQFNFLETGKGAGPASQSFSIPERILKNPQFAWLAKTHYGMKYLALVWGQLCGQVVTLCGPTNP